MKITFISLFPEYFDNFKKHSIIKNAIKKNIVKIETINPRDFSEDNQVDDTIYGGGAGMLLMIEPIVKAIRSVKTKDSHVVFVGPRGKVLEQRKVKALKEKKHIILICGHYEGVDSRIINYIDEEISIGEFIITGGELASMIIADSVIRILPGTIKEESYENESFEKNGLVEYDQFTKPINFDGHKVPEVLLGGNHKNINKWRKQNSLDRTIELELKKGSKYNGN